MFLSGHVIFKNFKSAVFSYLKPHTKKVKYRASYLGKDCAFEVLKNYMAGKKHLQRLSEYAETLQIKGVLYPYLEVLAA